MSLTNEEINYIRTLREQGVSSFDAMSKLGMKRLGYDTPVDTTERDILVQKAKKGESFFSQAASDLSRGFQGAVDRVDEGVDRIAQKGERENIVSRNLGRFATGVGTAGSALAEIGEGAVRALPGGDAVVDTAENVIGGAVETGMEVATAVDEATGSKISGISQELFNSLPKVVQNQIKDTVEGIGGALAIGATAVAPGLAGTGIKTFTGATRNRLSNLNLNKEGSVASEYFDSTDNRVKDATETMKTTREDKGILDKALDKAIEGASGLAQTYRTLVDASQTRITSRLDETALAENLNLSLDKIENNIADMYVNSISPGVKGKRKSLAGIQANKGAAVSAIKDITVNKDNIEFRDVETNELVKGELPTNIWEFGSSIATRKSQVYNQVLDSIEKSSDTPIDTSRIIGEMNKIIENPIYARLPEVQNKAEQIKQLYTTNQFNARQIEDLIQLENDGLQAFYRGGGTQADSIVNAIVANNLRDILDETVEAATGSGIKPLKAQYGSLKAIEQDVVHRALHNSQAREAGLVDMFGIRTIGDLSRGAVGDLGALRQGAGQILGEGFIKALNDRDALVNRMFKVAEQTYKVTNE